MKFIFPVEPGIITSGFGPRPKPNGPLHPGLDWHAALRQPIRAVADGIVARSYLSSNRKKVPVWSPEAGPDGKPVQLVVNGKLQWTMADYLWRPGDPTPDVMGYGETILLAHPDGRLTRYAHLCERVAEEGAHVAQGQIIGFAGTTGYSFGVHLHWELRGDGGKTVFDPTHEFDHLNPQFI